MKRLIAHAAAAVLVAVLMVIAPTEHDQARSGKWPSVRAAHLEIEPACAGCGKTKDLEVHHRLPFHEHPELELDQDNLITLCRRCHQLLGHLDNWQSWNEHVRDDAALILKRIKERPKKEK